MSFDERFAPNWREPDGTAYADMVATLGEAQLQVPALPLKFESSLRCDGHPWAWGTDPEITSWVLYMLVGGVIDPQIERCLEPDRPDFFMFGHRGHGIGSMGLGLLVRLGPIFIAQQHLWGGAFMDRDRANDSVNGATEVWSETLRSLGGCEDEPLRVAVLHSSFRHYAEILMRDDNAPSSDGWLAPRGWRSLWSGSTDSIEGLLDLHFHADPVVAVAAAHLASLLALDRRHDHQPNPIVAGEGTDRSSTRSVPAQSTIANEIAQTSEEEKDDDVEVGLDDLVDAILEPYYDSSADWAYWKKFVELTGLVFGLDGRDHYLKMAIENLPSRVIPMQTALEVPKEISAGFAAVPDVHRRVDDLLAQMRQLQREFFRGVILAIDPTIEPRRTTIRRLRELGLPKRRYVSFDDMY